MHTVIEQTATVAASPVTTVRGRPITQYSRRRIFAIWAAAAVPMAVLSWVVAPAIADGGGIESLFPPLLACLTAGLIWQFALVVGLVGFEQRTLRWSVVREALWLRKPRSPRTGRVGGRVWLMVIPFIIGTAIQGALVLPSPVSRDVEVLFTSDAGAEMFQGSWGLFGLLVTMAIFNTVLGEELLFRGLLLPRMNGAFGDRDWIANGVLFAAYHLHEPWVIPTTLMDTFLIAYPSKRYRSSWMGIAIHSGQSVLLILLVLTLVL